MRPLSRFPLFRERGARQLDPEVLASLDQYRPGTESPRICGAPTRSQRHNKRRVGFQPAKRRSAGVVWPIPCATRPSGHDRARCGFVSRHIPTNGSPHNRASNRPTWLPPAALVPWTARANQTSYGPRRRQPERHAEYPELFSHSLLSQIGAINGRAIWNFTRNRPDARVTHPPHPPASVYRMILSSKSRMPSRSRSIPIRVSLPLGTTVKVISAPLAAAVRNASTVVVSPAWSLCSTLAPV